MQRISQDKAHDYPKDLKGWANLINQWHDEAIVERRPREFQWAVNTAYYHGFQHLSFNRLTWTIKRDMENDDFIINRIAPYVETRVAKLTRAKPVQTVVPDKQDPITLKGAELSEMLSKYLWKVQRKDEKLRMLAFLMTLTGTSFSKTIWNSNGGKPIYLEQDESGNIVFDEKTGRQKPNVVFQGDIECHVKSPFAILASPGAVDFDTAEWIIDRSFSTVGDVLNKFKLANADKLKQLSCQMTEFEKFVNNLSSPGFQSIAGFTDVRKFKSNSIKEQQIVLVKEFWMRPNAYYPKGIFATVIGDQVVQFEEWPYEHREYPYARFSEHEDPFCFYGDCTLNRLIPIQKHYNMSRTQVAKNTRLMANGKILAPKGHGIPDDAFTDEEGEFIEYNPALPAPAQLPIAPLPNYVFENLNQDLLDMRDCSGEREASQLPFPGITAGVALETAAELSDMILIPTLRNIESGLLRMGRQELMLANEFYNDERSVQIFGKTNKPMVLKFKNTDLRYQTDITIQIESNLGYTKSAARQQLIDFWDRRIITDTDTFLKAYLHGDMDIILKQKSGVENVAIEELEEIKQGKEPVISQFDNHIVHVKLLSEFIQTPEFRRMPPDRQQLAVQVLQQHLGFLGQGPMAQQPEANQAAVGTPFGEQVTEGMSEMPSEEIGVETSPEAAAGA